MTLPVLYELRYERSLAACSSLPNGSSNRKMIFDHLLVILLFCGSPSPTQKIHFVLFLPPQTWFVPNQELQWLTKHFLFIHILWMINHCISSTNNTIIKIQLIYIFHYEWSINIFCQSIFFANEWLLNMMIKTI